MTTEETIGVLYNACYGGWHVSDKVIKIYNQHMTELNPEYIPISSYMNFKRHDPILVKIYYEIGNVFNESEYSSIKITIIPKKYEKYYKIVEYDGLEYVDIDINKYKLDVIKKIIINNMDSNQKISEINKLLVE